MPKTRMCTAEERRFFTSLSDQLVNLPENARNEVNKHISYLYKNCGNFLDTPVNEHMLDDALLNINNIINQHRKYLDNTSLYNIKYPIYLGNDLLLCKLEWGGYVVAPSWNIDVAIGAIRDGVIEASLTKLVVQILNPGDKVINVGANFGYYVSLAGSLVGPSGYIWGFEANPDIFRILLKTLYYAGVINHTSVYNRAVSNINDHNLEFFFDYQFLGGGRHCAKSPKLTIDSNLRWETCDINMLLKDNGEYNRAGLYTNFYARTITLDTVLQNIDIDLLLIDAEGAEPYIIMGAQNLINRSKNIKIIFEYTSLNLIDSEERRSAIEEMFTFLEDRGFVVQQIYGNLDNGEVKLSEKIRPTHMLEREYGVENFLATRER